MLNDALKITLDTYILHDYFLYYSPVLLAAASIHLCMQFTLETKSSQSNFRELTLDERKTIQRL